MVRFHEMVGGMKNGDFNFTKSKYSSQKGFLFQHYFINDSNFDVLYRHCKYSGQL